MKYQTQTNSWQVSQDREGSRAKVPHRNSCELSLNLRIDTRRDLLCGSGLQRWLHLVEPKVQASSGSKGTHLRLSAKDETTPAWLLQDKEFVWSLPLVLGENL